MPSGVGAGPESLWFEQRRWRFVGREPDTEGMRYVGALIRAMRSHV